MPTTHRDEISLLAGSAQSMNGFEAEEEMMSQTMADKTRPAAARWATRCATRQATAGLMLAGLLAFAAPGCGGTDDEGVVGDALSLDVSGLDSSVGADGTQGDAVVGDGLNADGKGTDASGNADAAADAAPADAGPCTGAVGCPCATKDDCDSALCVGIGDAAVCGLDCKGGCDDTNPCTVDLCQPATATGVEPACAHAAAADGGTCDDSNPCTGDGACTAGSCAAGAVKDCADTNPCTTDYCDKSGTCQHDGVSGKPCDDGDVCSVGDACASGACAAGKAQLCDDSNPCTADTCDAKKGCVSTDDDGKSCDDGDACTGDTATADTCKAGSCVAGGAKSCDDDDPCTLDGCASDKGCTHGLQAGAPCSDGDVCTVGDVCGAKGCDAGKAQPCDDGNPCTDNSCDKVNGCVSLPNTVTCTDGNACTTGDACEAAACSPGKLTSCDDNNPCTTDACDPGDGKSSGGCVNSAADGGACVPQDDSCAVTGICAAKACKKVAVTGCDDGNPCTTDACDKATGTCVYNAGKLGVTCDDGNVCTEKDACATGGCKGAARGCSDGNACTTDACDPSVTGGCVNAAGAGLSCNDGDLCTANDACKNGACAAGGKLACDDGNPCTDDSCDAKKGCVNAANSKPCDDNNGCTAGDVCGQGASGVAVCKPGAAKTCDDGKHCTKDICDPKASGGAGGCVSTPDDGLGCDDGDVCTEGDVCKSSTCTSGPAQLCNDDNVCTKDACDPKKGCVTTAIPGPCNDGDICSVGDTCNAGKCAPGKLTVCDDNNACTSDSCHYQKGCVYAALTGACNDGDACTSGDACQGGKCAGAKPTVCDDGNICTDDSCDKLKGCLIKPNTKVCDDNNVCSLGDACSGGTCKAGLKTKVCTDGKVCTADECDKVKGCQFPANSAECSDGDACTKNDQCDTFKCISGPKLSCDDHNLCTDDSCNTTTGCIHAKNSHPAFKAIVDNTTNDSGLWALSASDNKVKWTFSGSYWRMLGSLYAAQRMTLKPVLDLSCAVAPTLYFEERYYGAPLSVEVSLDNNVWTVVHNGTSGSDYVWRPREVDLSGYIGKKVYLRFATAPSNSTYWSNLRLIEMREKKPAPKLVTWGAAMSCGDFVMEGPLFQCVKDGAGYQLQTKGAAMTPEAYKYANIARFNVRFDRTKVKLPRLVLEERHRYSSLSVRIRQAGELKWQTVWQRPGGGIIDPIWRQHRIDLGNVPGDVWEVAIATNYGNTDFWMDLRNIAFTTTPADLTPHKAPYKWTKCDGLDLEGDALTCDPTSKVYDYRWETGSTGDKGTYSYWHRINVLRRVDLTALTNPIVRYYQRYYRGDARIEASLDGIQWTSHTYQNYGASDYVWREVIGDLSQYKGKVIWLRMAINPRYSSSVWGEIKGLEVADTPKAWPVVKWGPQTFTCSQWAFEGTGWTCDGTTGLKQVGNSDQPSPNAYYQAATYQRTFDLTGVSNAVVRFEQLSRYGELQLDVRKKGGGWLTVWSRGNALDPIFRHVEVDLSAYSSQQIELRFNGRPLYPETQPQSLEIRNVTLGTKATLPTITFGAAMTCNLWRKEGDAFTCDPNLAKWTWRVNIPKNDGTQSYYHHAELMAWVDLTKAVDPQIYFDYADYGSTYFYMQVITEGGKWLSLNTVYNLPDSQFLTEMRYDLSPYVGKKVRFRMLGRPASSSYWTELHNISLRERDKITSLKPGAAVTTKDFRAEGSWAYDTKDATWKSGTAYFSAYQTLRLKSAFDLSGASKPELRFLSRSKHTYQLVDVSTDGVQWSNVWLLQTSGQHVPDFEPIIIDLSPWAGQKQIFVRFQAHPYGSVADLSHWWVKNVTIAEHVSLPVVKAPVTLTTAHLNMTGEWKQDATTGAFTLNYPASAAIDATYTGYHQLWPKVRLDLSGLTTPELTFTTRRYNALPYVDISVDQGITWQTLQVVGVEDDVVWREQSVDLGAYKGNKSVMIRVRARPGNKAYWWQVKDLRVDNRFVYPSVKADTISALTAWKLEQPGWSVNAAGYLERKVDAINKYTYATLLVSFDLKTVPKPVLHFEETGLNVSRYVEVSDDNIIWQTFTVPGAAPGATWTAKSIDLPSFGGSPTVYVRIRGHIAVKDRYWRVRKLTISKK